MTRPEWSPRSGKNPVPPPRSARSASSDRRRDFGTRLWNLTNASRRLSRRRLLLPPRTTPAPPRRCRRPWSRRSRTAPTPSCSATKTRTGRRWSPGPSPRGRRARLPENGRGPPPARPAGSRARPGGQVAGHHLHVPQGVRGLAGGFRKGRRRRKTRRRRGPSLPVSRRLERRRSRSLLVFAVQRVRHAHETASPRAGARERALRFVRALAATCVRVACRRRLVRRVADCVFRIDAVGVDVSAPTPETTRGVRTMRSFTPAPGEPRRAAVAVLLLPRAHASPRALALVLAPCELVQVRLDLAHHQRVHRGAVVRGRLGLGLGILSLRSARKFLLCSSFGVACPLPGCPRNVGCFCDSTPWSSSAVVRASPAVSSSPELQDVPAAARAPPLSPRRLHPRRICTAGQRTSLAASPRRRGAHRSGARLGGTRSRVNGDERVTLTPVRAAKRPAERRRLRCARL